MFVWTFDLDEDILYYSECFYWADGSCHIQLPLARLRSCDSDPVQKSEFIPFQLSPPPQLDLAGFAPPFRKPSRPVSERLTAFTSRIIFDLANQWQHILRSSYAESTLRQLARAIVDIATSNYRIDENSARRQHISVGRAYVAVLNMPGWEPCKDMFVVGETTIILRPDLQSAFRIAKDAVKASSSTISLDRPAQHCATFLLLSVRHMMVCHVDSAGEFSYTSPTTFMNGLTLPSPRAINLLLQALSPSRPPPRTPIHRLPVEIQDRILDFVSEGPVAAAKLGCILGLGSPFNWLRATDPPRRTGAIELVISPSHRHENTPVESKIFFGDVFSGVSYK